MLIFLSTHQITVDNLTEYVAKEQTRNMPKIEALAKVWGDVYW